MFKYDILEKTNFGKTRTISKTLNIGTELDLFISMSSKNSAFLDYIYNKILDFTIDRISAKNTYKDFSHSLELINRVLKNWYENTDDKINIIIGILNKNEFLFSNIGTASCYLVKDVNVIEITESKDKRREFSFISNGKLEDNDIITMSNRRILSFLSESDFIDSYDKKIKKFNFNINQILEEENIEKNITINSFIYKNNKTNKTNKNLNYIKTIGLKIGDTNFIKRIIAIYLITKDYFSGKEKIIKGLFFIMVIFFIIFSLYTLIGKTISNNTGIDKNEQFLIKLEEAKTVLKQASENTTNKDIFNLKIEHTERIIKKLEEKKLFLEDISLLKERISKLKKTFDGIEIFIENSNNKIIDLKDNDIIKIVGLNKKIYLIGKNYIIGPINKGEKPKKFIFDKLKNDEFRDATILNNNISLLTKKGNIVLFSTNGNFKVTDVIGQINWEFSDLISSYYGNIYLVSKKDNQLYKHKKIGESFGKKIPYFTNYDKISINNIVDIAIDGGIYLIQNDLKIRKFFHGKKNRIEKITLNKFPDNYKQNKEKSDIQIKTRAELNYVYILLNNKIFITKPNSRRNQDTKSLEYLGQIEGEKYKIIDFYVKYDGEILILNKIGLFKIKFEENNEKILIR